MKKQTSVKIYNTLTRKKDILKPLKGKKVNLFVCGPTVYDFSHIGHARTYIIFDCFAKYLKHVGFKVFYLQNITDVDDKIIQQAREKGVSTKDLAGAFEKEYLKDMKTLGVTSVTKYARATAHIKEIISQVNRLIKKGYAYSLPDGIYFNISKFKRYGKLSGRTVLQAEDSISRIDHDNNKKNRGDFCLWKLAESQENWEPKWPSPFGLGRPGWHIEDTAITEKFFGAQYDIHGGGHDLIFPHHEAEVTQMEAVSGKKPLAKYWMHTGFLTLQGQKMGKSLGNSTTINSFLKRYTPFEMRFWIAKHLWSSPIDYSESAMIEVRASLEKIEEFLRKVKAQKGLGKPTAISANIKKLENQFWQELADDFNTPKAFASVFEFIKETNGVMDSAGLTKKDAKDILAFFEDLDSVFGIIDAKKLKKSNIPAEVKSLLARRETYRKEKNWEKSDELRKEIEKYGFTVDDTKDGAVLKKII